MPISQDYYVSITSGVGGQSQIPGKQLQLRIYTSDASVVPGVTTYNNKEDVLAVFGVDSREYKIALYYFGYVSKTVQTPKSMQIADYDTVNETPEECVSRHTENDNNYATFDFVDTLTLPEKTTLAAWNHNNNYDHWYIPSTVAASAAEDAAAMDGYIGTSITLTDGTDEDFSPYLPAAQLASQNYSKAAAANSYKYMQDSRLSPVVTENSGKPLYDDLFVNYYGETQVNGARINFYQEGRMLGDGHIQMGVFANEMWLKGFIREQFINMFLVLPQIDTGNTGRAIAVSYLQTAVDAGILNGSIIRGKSLDNTQIQYITQVTGDDTAYEQIQRSGYWFEYSIESRTIDGAIKYVGTYTLLYAKADSIGSIEGRDILI